MLLNNYPRLLLLLCSSLILATSYAKEISLRQALGNSVVIIDNHTIAEMAKLKIMSVAESQQYAHTSADRFSGYPIIGKLKPLEKVKSQQLAKLILDNNNYVFNVLRRCKNHSLYGIRFKQGQKKIELALGIPCNQTIITFKDNEKIKWWGEVLGDKVTKKVLMLLGE